MADDWLENERPNLAAALVPNPMLLVFLDLSLEEIDTLCRLSGKPKSDGTDGFETAWFEAFLSSRRDGYRTVNRSP